MSRFCADIFRATRFCPACCSSKRRRNSPASWRKAIRLIAPLAGLKLTALRGVKILGAARPGDVVRLEAASSGASAI
jgi:hypothetical protein